MSDDQRLIRIEQKLDDQNDHLSSMAVTLAEQHVSLEEHMRRTSIIEEDMKPIKAHVTLMNNIAKIVTFIVTILGAYKLFK